MKTDKQLKKLSTGLVGVAGEYFVAAELSRRGYVASITLHNTRGIDILASNADASRQVAIQVKANHETRKVWMLNEKDETRHAENHFYVFIALGGVGLQPAYHVVPSKVVADYVRDDHARWKAAPNRKGGAHGYSAVRHFIDTKNAYLDRWDVLGLTDTTAKGG
jgi:hypothetical protein